MGPFLGEGTPNDGDIAGAFFQDVAVLEDRGDAIAGVVVRGGALPPVVVEGTSLRRTLGSKRGYEFGIRKCIGVVIGFFF